MVARFSEYNCRGGSPWPPVIPNRSAENGRPRRAAPTVVFRSHQVPNPWGK